MCGSRLSLTCGAEPEGLGLAAATGVGIWEPMEWSLEGAWLAKCKMRFCGHFAPWFIMISHQQLLICEQCLSGLSGIRGSA